MVGVAIHVAILKRPYVRAILDGRKIIESRITRTACPPFGRIEPGERIYIKISSGPFAAVATAGPVHQFEALTPKRMDALRGRFNAHVGGDEAYWNSKRDCSYAVFIELRDVEPCDVGPPYRKSMQAWHVLDDRLDPIAETRLTAGALRNGYATAPGRALRMRQGRFTLLLPDGQRVQTDIARGNMIRWRGWRRYYHDLRLQPNDRVRFVAVGDGRYRVSFHECNGRRPA